MVKILMVHGFGVNAAIFEAQTGTSMSTYRPQCWLESTSSTLHVVSVEYKACKDNS